MRLSDRFIELMQMEKEDVANIVTDLENILDEIDEIVAEPCIDGMDCNTCEGNCMNKDILKLIKQAKEGK